METKAYRFTYGTYLYVPAEIRNLFWSEETRPTKSNSPVVNVDIVNEKGKLTIRYTRKE